MKIMKHVMAGILFFCLCMTQLFAQGPVKKGKQAKPEGLVIAIADNGTGKRIEAIEPVAAYLSKELNIPVRATVANNAVDLLEQIKDGSVDIAYINGFGYVLGVSDSIPLVPLVTPGNADGTPNTYNSCIISSPKQGISSMADLIATANQRSFLFVNPTSTSGHLIPRLYLTKMGLQQVEVDFRDVNFADNHYATIDRVLAGEVDAGAVAYNIIENRIAKGELKNSDVNVLWVSEGITQEPVVVNKSMEVRLQKKITQAMLKMHSKDPELWKHIQQNFSAREATRYVPAKDSYYNSIRNVSGRIEDLLFILNFYIN
ncbi:MAG: phosphate/phosphite/phosphonate ABC transporter substrate-binding protein [Bacteroidetes bacterium]|nr:phosphate/phosphite/phosphonate ABC transporter substrate-binding protein [Bacteroidota bacterium]